jgi:hypothetical protein
LFIPDARFYEPSVSYLEKYIVKIILKQLLLQGPPQLTSYRFGIKTKLDLTWFADFRDPWTTMAIIKLCDYQITPLKSIRC